MCGLPNSVAALFLFLVPCLLATTTPGCGSDPASEGIADVDAAAGDEGGVADIAPDADADASDATPDDGEGPADAVVEAEADDGAPDLDSVADDGVEDDAEVIEPVTYTYAVKTINYPLADILQVLPRFAERGLTLYLNVQPKHLGDEALAQVLAEATSAGVPVKLWPLLTEGAGAWCNEDNLEAFWANVFTTLDHIETLTHNIDTVVINSELGPPKIDLIHQHFAAGDWTALIDLILANVDRDAFDQAVVRSQELVAELHARGYQAQITTYPYLLDDLLDGDPDIQDAANVVLSGVDWDRAAFTAYSAAYTADFGKPFGPDFVYSYAKMAVDAYGDRADIALGLVFQDSDHAYETPDQLAADVAAAKAAGVHHIDVFALKGMLADERFDEWADALLAEPLKPPVEANTEQFHADFALADTALDGAQAPE